MKLVNKKTGALVAEDAQDMKKLIKDAIKDIKKAKVFYYRKRVGYNKYVIEVWSDDPVLDAAKAVLAYEIQEVSRKNIGDTKEIIKPKQKPRPLTIPKPTKPLKPEPITKPASVRRKTKNVDK